MRLLLWWSAAGADNGLPWCVRIDGGPTRRAERVKFSGEVEMRSNAQGEAECDGARGWLEGDVQMVEVR